MNVAWLLSELNSLGYDLWSEEGNISFRYRHKGEPPQEKARPLLEEVKSRKAEIISYLMEVKAFEMTEAAPEPFIEKCGTLVIPFDCHPRYHWWNGGQSVKETEGEVKAWKH